MHLCPAGSPPDSPLGTAARVPVDTALEAQFGVADEELTGLAGITVEVRLKRLRAPFG